MESSSSTVSTEKSYTITKTWDGSTPADSAEIKVTFSRPEDPFNGLVITVDAPLYKDPQVPLEIPVGSMDKLWDYEVVEIFLLSEDNKYLEIELAPSGHYLLLQFHGSREMIEEGMELEWYKNWDNCGRWTGKVIIPYNYLPKNISRFNAFAIHKSDPHRNYMALWPTPPNKYPHPDFHRLSYFQSIDLTPFIKIV